MNAVFGHVRAPDELSPTVKSKQNLMRAARLCRQLGSYDVTPTDVAQAHTANLALVNDPNFEQDCEAEFLHDGPIRVAFVAAVPDHPSTQTLRSPAPDNAGFFLKIYHHPAFQHWLTQVILAAVVLTAVGVVAAFMLNASMLPLAVAGVVKGLSSMVAKTVFGSALVIGTAATFTLAASLQARFFSEARDDAAPPAGAGLTPIVAHL